MCCSFLWCCSPSAGARGPARSQWPAFGDIAPGWGAGCVADPPEPEPLQHSAMPRIGLAAAQLQRLHGPCPHAKNNPTPSRAGWRRAGLREHGLLRQHRGPTHQLHVLRQHLCAADGAVAGAAGPAHGAARAAGLCRHVRQLLLVQRPERGPGRCAGGLPRRPCAAGWSEMPFLVCLHVVSPTSPARQGWHRLGSRRGKRGPPGVAARAARARRRAVAAGVPVQRHCVQRARHAEHGRADRRGDGARVCSGREQCDRHLLRPPGHLQRPQQQPRHAAAQVGMRAPGARPPRWPPATCYACGRTTLTHHSQTHAQSLHVAERACGASCYTTYTVKRGCMHDEGQTEAGMRRASGLHAGPAPCGPSLQCALLISDADDMMGACSLPVIKAHSADTRSMHTPPC